MKYQKRVLAIPYIPDPTRFFGFQYLVFTIEEATRGKIVQAGKDIVLQCQIHDTTCTFTHQHLSVLNNREINQLCHHLGIDSNKLGV
ncbi:MAG: hypothetical protein F6K09_09225 [Merismopedia sp. SIO2A8]|nr:hypothetical protein [Symploca sp. SIO2B6]NET48890.1 hypothetical protein [Merismopedia sp. SIO2A8]